MVIFHNKGKYQERKITIGKDLVCVAWCSHGGAEASSAELAQIYLKSYANFTMSQPNLDLYHQKTN